jgi:hypothetical protein
MNCSCHFQWPPVYGVPQGVAEDLFWVRLPLPFRLNHVNIWLLKTDNGWAAIDCGTDSSELRSIWKDLIAAPNIFEVCGQSGFNETRCWTRDMSGRIGMTATAIY